MTEYRWQPLRDKAAKAFGDSPDGDIERELIEAFRVDPRRLTSLVEETIDAAKSGKLHSPWRFLRSKLRKADETDVVVSDAGARQRAIATGESWLRGAGLHFDRQSEVEDELFGDRGKLREWADDEPLRERLLGLWRQLAPQGAQVEAEADERAERWRESRKRVEEIRKQHRAEKLAELELQDVRF